MEQQEYSISSRRPKEEIDDEGEEYSIIIRRPKEEIDDEGEEYSIIIIIFIIIRDDPDSRDLFPPTISLV